MATVTGVTAEKAQEIADGLLVGAQRQGSSLVLQTAGGAVFNINNAFIAPYETTPVNGILMTVNSANPATYLGGGTWVRWGQGRVPVSQDPGQAEFDTADEVGGSKTHTLTVAQMPSHNHGGATGYQSADHYHTGSTTSGGGHEHVYANPNDRTGIQGGGGATVADSGRTNTATGGGGVHGHDLSTAGASANHTHEIGSEGGGTAHNIMQPYIVCYMWKRTA